jgi:pyruvate/2-oxoglutarate dehydrogenase complex dihydrolipoamide acyltransferase (E2) component
MIQDLNVEKSLAYIKKLNEEQKEVKITMTHISGYACAIGMHKIRRDVGRIVWGYFKHSKKIGTTCLVDVEGGKDLIPVTIWDAHTMTLLEFALKINEKIKRAQQNKDKAHQQSTLLANYMPSFIV